MKKLFLTALSIGCITQASYGIDINVGTGTCNGSYVAICSQMDAEVRELVEGDLPDVDLGQYATGIANANSFAYKGMGSDYSDKYDLLMVKVTGGGAFQGDASNPEKAEGIGIGAALTAGVNLDLLPIDKIGFIDLSKLDLSFSVMSYNVDQKQDSTQVNGDIGHFSVMARYQLVDSIDVIPGYMFQWGGVFLHTGLHRQTMDAKIVQSFTDQQVEVSGQSATFQDANATFNIDSTTLTIPVEVSTHLRTLWALTFFGGAGFDIVSGSTDINLTASGNINGGSGGNTYANTINASELNNGDAEATNFRAFGGLQFNLPFVRLTTHFNKGLGNDLMGFNVGAKFLW